MSASVEARSLTSLNFLAANPPQYPVNPAEERQEPVILYISRVPGTRDIILSTFKPQIKNVTAEDVANSLYYVHLELAPDMVALPPPPPLRDPDSSRSSLDSQRSQPSQRSANLIHRKPLPLTAQVARPPRSVSELPPSTINPPAAVDNFADASRLDEDFGQILDVPPELPPRPPEIHRRPLNLPSSTSPVVHRKPLGPRPMTGARPSTADKDLQPTPGVELPPAAPLANTPPRTAGGSFFTPVRRADRSVSSNKPWKQGPFVPFSLTLIRRDPSSGHQWNVGKVSSYQMEQTDEEDAGASVRGYFLQPDASNKFPPISIHLETSGYAKFRGMPARMSLDGPRSASTTSLPRSLGSLTGETDDMLTHKDGSGFYRQVFMTYRQSMAWNIKERFRRSESQEAQVQRPVLGHSRNVSNMSAGSADSSGSGGESGPPPLITTPGQGLKPKGYTFLSPWDGRCEFRTGSGGRSVKCDHILHNSSGSSNPLVPSSQGRHGSAWTGSAAVSELRFNLPSSELFKSKGEASSTMYPLHGHFSKLLKLDYGHESDEDDPVSPFELPLGKEKAGGGNRGKRAKLGKLIIHNEGLKMLDLVVAANMGVWWAAWERSF